MPNYNNGKIYKITSPSTKKIYIGSTTKDIERRLIEHKCNYKKYLKGNFKYCTSYEVIKYQDSKVELIENVNCDNKIDLFEIERKYIITLDNVCNKVIPNRTRAEYRKDNRNIINMKKKIYREQNQDKIKAYSKIYSQRTTKCDVCNKEMKLKYFISHKKSNIHQKNLINNTKEIVIKKPQENYIKYL